MFFSCVNKEEEIKDFFADRNLPIGHSENVYHVYKDSGRISSKMFAPLFLDFSNRKNHPYSEFPKGIEIVSFQNGGLDSITIKGDYAINYTDTFLSHLVGNVVVVNHKDGSVLETEEIYWDDKSNYFFTDTDFKMTQEESILYGEGFESNQDLSKRRIFRPYGSGPLEDK